MPAVICFVVVTARPALLEERRPVEEISPWDGRAAALSALLAGRPDASVGAVA